MAPIHQQESQSRSRRDQHSKALWEAREAHQWALEAAHTLAWNIERLSWGMEDAPQSHPCSHSANCPWTKSLDRHTRSPSQHRPERQMTFWEPEVDSESGRPYRGSKECSLGTHNGGSSRVPLPA